MDKKQGGFGYFLFLVGILVFRYLLVIVDLMLNMVLNCSHCLISGFCKALALNLLTNFELFEGSKILQTDFVNAVLAIAIRLTFLSCVFCDYWKGLIASRLTVKFWCFIYALIH